MVGPLATATKTIAGLVNGNGHAKLNGHRESSKDAADMDPEAVLAQMTIEEKIAMLSGDDHWHTAPVERLGIPRVRTSDGPVGFILLRAQSYAATYLYTPKQNGVRGTTCETTN